MKSSLDADDRNVVMLPTLEDILMKKRAAQAARNPDPATSDASQGGCENPLSELEQREREQREYERRLTARVLEEARERAKQEADAVLAQAQKERESILAQAREEGFASGRAEVFAQAADALALLDDGYRSAIANLEKTAEGLFAQIEPDMLDTALQIARRIMHIEFDRNDEAYMAIVRHILPNVMNQRNIVLRVSDWEYKRFFGDGGSALAAELAARKIIVERDAALDKSECRLQSEYGDISVGIEIQLKRLGHALGENW